MIVIRSKNFGMPYDETDNIKRMKDSDILAAKKKSNTSSYVNAGKAGVAGAAAGSVVGAIAGGIRSKSLKGIKNGAKAGAAIGGAGSAAISLAAGHGKREQNRQYNNRLSQAKYQAKRREGVDWHSQTHNREGYTY